MDQVNIHQIAYDMKVLLLLRCQLQILLSKFPQLISVSRIIGSWVLMLFIIFHLTAFGPGRLTLAVLKEVHMNQDCYKQDGSNYRQRFIPEACAASVKVRSQDYQ